jgi:uracil-DNA glycosylase
MENIQEYQQKCFSQYKKDIGYPEEYTYLYGNPINVLVPIETTKNKIMIVGAYPSAKFYTLGKITDVPLSDNDSPFSNESYFDGSRVRTIPSGKELNDFILKQIGIKREDCWVTDLVKVFLFKQGHIERYSKLGRKDIQENRSKLKEYAKESIPWLIREIKLAEPRVIILLGAEVASVLFKTTEGGAKKIMDGTKQASPLKGITVPFICLPHPGILMKPSSKNPWPKRFLEEIAPTAKAEIQKL